MNFFTIKPESFGLDFSDLSLKIIKLKKKGRSLDLASWGEVKIKPGVIEQGEVLDKETLINIIKEALTKIKGKKINVKNVVASLPEKKAFLQVIKMPNMKKEELETAIPFEAENHIPLPIDEVYLDFQVISSARSNIGQYIDVLIVAIPKKIVDPYVFCIKEAGLYPLAMEIESQSISRALIKNGISIKPVLLIDFGRSRTSFIIFSGYSLRFTSSISISSYKLTESLSQSLNISINEAEKIKIKYGLKAFSKKTLKNKEIILQKKMSKAMTPILNDFVKQIRRYINYYQSHFKNGNLLSDGRRLDKVILCGRGANLKGLTDFLSSELKVPVELGNPWINILSPSSKKIPEMPFKESLGFTSSLGLALRCEFKKEE